MERLTAGWIPPSRIAVVRGVAANDALRVAGISPQRAHEVFGAQAQEREFLPALGCALSHLIAARTALADHATPALVLEEDVVLDLRPFWQCTVGSSRW